MTCVHTQRPFFILKYPYYIGFSFIGLQDVACKTCMREYKVNYFDFLIPFKDHLRKVKVHGYDYKLIL